jgi:hypothetical protein
MNMWSFAVFRLDNRFTRLRPFPPWLETRPAKRHRTYSGQLHLALIERSNLVRSIVFFCMDFVCFAIVIPPIPAGSPLDLSAETCR